MTDYTSADTNYLVNKYISLRIICIMYIRMRIQGQPDIFVISAFRKKFRTQNDAICYDITDEYLRNYLANKNGVNWVRGVKCAAYAGRLDLIKFYGKGKGKDLDGLVITITDNAALGGHLDIVTLYNYGAASGYLILRHAAQGGYMHIIEYLINECNVIDWNSGMYGAIIGDHMDLIEFFISKGADNWVSGLNVAVQYGHIDIIKFFINKGTIIIYPYSYDAGLCNNSDNHLDVIKLLDSMKKYQDRFNFIYNAAFIGRLDIINYCIDSGTNFQKQQLINLAASGGYLHIIKYFKDESTDLEQGLQCAVRGYHIDVIKFFINRGGCNWYEASSHAILNGNRSLIKFFNKLIAANSGAITISDNAVI